MTANTALPTQPAPTWRPLTDMDGAGQDADAVAFRPIRVDELLAMEIKPREQVLGPIIQEKGLAMLHAKRGIGKTYLALGIAFATASGGQFLRWSAPRPRSVLYIDGEMPLIVLQERVKSIVLGSDLLAEPERLQFLAADYFEDGLPNLSTTEGQERIEPFLDGVELVILDNLATLTSAVRDNEAESWTPIQGWLLSLRRRGVSVLLVHHSNKGGAQRGTSAREDVLDTIIRLSHPDDYAASEGARFEVFYEKTRGFYGDDAKEFEARLETRDGAAFWTTRDMEDARAARIADLLREDPKMSLRDMAEITGIPKTTVGRIKTKLQAEARS